MQVELQFCFVCFVTMMHVTRRPQLPRHAVRLARGTVRHAATQERILTQMQKRMHAKHADGPASGMLVHGSGRSAPTVESSASAAAPVPSARFAGICLHLR